MLNINPKIDIKPLSVVTIECIKGNLSVRDGEGREYFTSKGEDKVSFKVAGALGTHIAFVLDNEGRIKEEVAFRVDCKTEIEDEGGRIKHLLDMLYYTCVMWGEGDNISRVDGKYYRYYVRWLRDHVHSLKGMKWFDGEHKTAIELYYEQQREDGMIYDYIHPATPEPTWRDVTFKEGNFIKPVADGWKRMARIPVENDVEFLYLEGIYYTWKATGDTEWMKKFLDSAKKAVNYSITDKYRWSEKYKLLKRGYTIDTWDFMSEYDNALTWGDNVCDVNKTTFGIMFGDNTGMMAGCIYLAEMLEAVGREEEAKEYRSLRDKLKENLDKVSWNGEFFTHHVSEDESFKRDFGGTDEKKQVSLSNAYSLNRGISHEQCVGIIKTYQKIREEMPKSSPGEFYQIYPPFEKGFKNKWHYMNGGVGPIVAGELSHGAFEHGYEEYGFDILDRVAGWGDAHDGYLSCAYRGCEPSVPNRQFKTIDISKIANANIKGTNGEPDNGVIGWTNEGANDLSNFPVGKKEYMGVDFDVISPNSNNGRVVIALSQREHYLDTAEIPINDAPSSIYFLHTKAGAGPLTGEMLFVYEDGEEVCRYIHDGKEIDSWFMPLDPVKHKKERAMRVCHRVAWRGENEKFPNIGVQIFGLNNPREGKKISHICLTPAKNNVMWFVLGVTTSSEEFLLPTDNTSFGIPDVWGAAAVIYAIMEGVGGMRDTGVGFNKALFAPRWTAGGVNKAKATAKYEASKGYMSYNYALQNDKISINLSTSSAKTACEILLPKSKKATKVFVNGEEIAFNEKKVENSLYACFEIEGVKAFDLEVVLA